MQSATFVMGWFVTGKADGRVTVEEMTNLIRGLAGIWKIRIDLDIGPSPIAPTQNLALALEAEDEDEDDFSTDLAEFRNAA